MGGTKTCVYLFKQGEKTGQKCGKNCRTKFCSLHKPTYIKKKAEWFQKKQESVNNKKIKEKIERILNIKDVDKLPDFITELKKLKNLKFDLIYQKKKAIGINIFLGINQEKQISNMELIMYGKCICCDDFKVTKQDIEKSKVEDPGILAYLTKDSEIKRKIKTMKKCSSCDKYDLDDCKYCNHPLRITFISYSGKKKEIAKKKLNKIESKIKLLKSKMIIKNKIINAIEECEKKLCNV